MTDAQREKWLKVMTSELMSSEESEGDSIVIHPLPWRSKYVSNMFEKIDGYCKRKKTSLAKRQTKTRKIGRNSNRLRPIANTHEIPDWAFNTYGHDSHE